MNGLFTLAFWDALGFNVLRVLISLAWQSSLLIGIAAAVAGILRHRSAKVRHSIWASLLCILPFIPLLVWAASIAGTPQIVLPVIPDYSVLSPVDSTPTPTLSPNADQTSVPPPPRLTDYPWAIGLFVYSAGALFFLSAITVSRFRIRRWIRHDSLVADTRVLCTFRQMGEHLGIPRPVTVIESGAITAPLTIGTVHPVILLPRGFSRQLSDPELHSLAVHELSHVRRYDSIVFTVVAVVRALLFFNPLLWFAAREVAVLAESVCDDAVVEVVNEPVVYAEMLTRLAVTLPKRLFTTELAAGFSISKHSFLRRVELILIERKNRFRSLSRAALIGVAGVLLASFVLVISLPLGCGKNDGNSVDRKALRNFGRWVHTVMPDDSSKMVTIRGIVVDPYGTPVDSAIVTPALTGTDNSLLGDDRYSFTTDAQGRFDIMVPSDGKYKYNLVAHDGDVHRTRTWANGVTEPLATKSGQVIENLTITLTEPCTVSGTVRDKDGKPMVDHLVSAHALDFRGNRYYEPRTETDDQGRYTLRCIRPGLTLIQSANMSPLDEEAAPKGLMKRVELRPGETLENIDLFGMPDKELLAWLRAHTPLKYKIRTLRLQAEAIISGIIKAIF